MFGKSHKLEIGALESREDRERLFTPLQNTETSL